MSAATVAGQARSAGLVSVPTTCTQVLTEGQRLAAAVRATEVADLAQEVGAFRGDPVLTRLARMRRAVGFGARAHAVSERGHRDDVPYMVTLTYRGVSDWKPDHLTQALRAVRMWCNRQGFALRYVWVAEMQKRGAIHYHLCIWLPRGVRMPKWDVRGWWPWGMSQRVVARHAVSYLMKYLSKGCDMAFPKGARTYGVGGLEHSLRRARRWLNLPRFVQRLSDCADDWKRADGGGWTAPDGRHFASEFRQVFVAGQRYLQRVRRHLGLLDPSGVEFDPSGPFSWFSRGTA